MFLSRMLFLLLRRICSTLCSFVVHILYLCFSCCLILSMFLFCSYLIFLRRNCCCCSLVLPFLQFTHQHFAACGPEMLFACCCCCSLWYRCCYCLVSVVIQLSWCVVGLLCLLLLLRCCHCCIAIGCCCR